MVGRGGVTYLVFGYLNIFRQVHSMRQNETYLALAM